MISFYINGEEVQVQLEGESTIGDVLKSFEMTCEQNQAAVIGISVDGNSITADNFDKEAGKALGKDTKFEFSVVTKDSIKQSFTALAQLFSQLALQMEEVPAALQAGKNAEVSNSITKVADSIDNLCHVAVLASLFPDDFKETIVEGKKITEFFQEFSPILLDFEEALKNNDTVLIGDLSEYEICPRLKAISEALEKI
ncbi:MAG: hypothetical protein IKR64_03565 [Treponema sp.]|nr:hypothetical protein [Treponema sp.]